jgi:hypothetical protein
MYVFQCACNRGRATRQGNDDGAIAEWRPGGEAARIAPGWELYFWSVRDRVRAETASHTPRPPTFIQWYESWLERLEIDLDDYNHFKSQDRRR